MSVGFQKANYSECADIGHGDSALVLDSGKAPAEKIQSGVVGALCHRTPKKSPNHLSQETMVRAFTAFDVLVFNR
jgi:hypothetical protein